MTVVSVCGRAGAGGCVWGCVGVCMVCLSYVSLFCWVTCDPNIQKEHVEFSCSLSFEVFNLSTGRRKLLLTAVTTSSTVGIILQDDLCCPSTDIMF